MAVPGADETIDRRAGSGEQGSGGVAVGDPASFTRPVSVLPSEQDRLISAQRQGRSVVRRGPDTTTESHTPVTTQLSAVTATTGAGGQVTAIAFH